MRLKNSAGSFCVSCLTLKVWRRCLIKSSCRAWRRTSRESLRQRQSWFQGKVHRSLQIQRWSPARSFSVTAQILRKKNILGEIYVFLMFPHRTRLTLQKRCSQWQCPSRRHYSPNYPVEELDNYREKLKRLELPFGFLFVLANWNLNKKFQGNFDFRIDTNWAKPSISRIWSMRVILHFSGTDYWFFCQ